MIPATPGLFVFIPSSILLTVALYHLLNELKIFNFQKANIPIAIAIALPAMYFLSFLSPFIGAASIFIIFTTRPKKETKMRLAMLLSAGYFLAASLVVYLL
ncbi:hypothetical protein A3K63_00785 [Candidatus Micrarchaeota archaeon RBG_16_49_10]|nr:MAG: hypothetical protein A3K63_00785 [Candidatus Micrarchaeota archaeon RBG_16_49_10]